jgi:hypothetical protein
VNAYSPYFDNPQFVFQAHLGKRLQKLAYKSFQYKQTWIARHSDDNNPTCSVRREAKNVCEVQIQGNQAALFYPAYLVKLFVRCALQRLHPHRLDIVPSISKDVLGASAKILVQLKLHVETSIGIST